MTFIKNLAVSLLVLTSIESVFSQKNLETVVAKNGDGILSILRNEGIDIAKYYEQFLELNEAKLSNGSRLAIGETYVIPHAPDSFKNRGVLVQIGNGGERPIFDEELATLRRKDSSLINTVYYLIEHDGVGTRVQSAPKDGIAVNMARRLLQSGARVYLLTSEAKDSLGLIDYVGEINKKYLKHNGDYQRLVVMNVDEVNPKTKTDVMVYHYAESEESKRFAANILKVFGGNVVKQGSLEDYSKVFTDFKSIAFAKNILPPITFINMGSEPADDQKTMKVTANRENIANLITNGILSDYSNTEFEEN
ncbi:N-acetylmuramoyl-L-alanine amidase [Maribacter polysiphoniae]|uniref:N-acetylmuramoyl-L-alanine amidase n=1 Tax=Maribacter polysiphoniae TaxID=429344 RepID=A0A316E8I1_9FLAO|nr:N-acetylmuramoyl-L-alanine amidase [Maribacter polysiphoniae]MBD1260503.1 N-acetylmuramoyl-L-alanine amidase [Maribacter polysiphoniae]PWK25968.1 N-acetylmuramoyl-L-alanine amidase [Maribacter polysiphoniae]